MLNDTEATEVNTKLAQILGWVPCDLHWDGCLAPGKSSLDSCHCSCTKALPDFCRDAHSFGWLIEYAQLHEWHVSILWDKLGAMFYWHDEDHPSSGYGETLNEAFCRAVIAYAESQKPHE